jgi:hypothetical protein
MDESVSKWALSWWGFLYGALMGLPSYSYVHFSRIWKIHGTSGMELSANWQFLNLLYLLADIVVLASLSFAWKRRTGAISQLGEFLRHDFVEIARVLTLWHLVVLVFEYPVSARLEAVGLGGLEAVVAFVFAVLVGPLIVRAFKAALRQYLGDVSGDAPEPSLSQ